MFNALKRIRHTLGLFRNLHKYGGVKYVRTAYPQVGDLLKDKVVLITGGGSGIGLAIAKRFAACGARVIISGRNETKLKNAINDIASTNAKYIVWDVSDIAALSDRLNECIQLFAQDIDILVNNAGVQPLKFWGQVDETEWYRIYDTNLKGAFFLTQELTKRWTRTRFDGYKKVLNISSQGGFVGATYPYRMAKWDIRGFTEGLAKELISKDIIVNAIAPGVVKTEMQRFSLQQGDNLYTNQNPVHRVCLPEEIAELALFLCGDTGNFIVGQTIVCDGGYTLR